MLAKQDGRIRYLWVNIGKHGCEFILQIARSHLHIYIERYHIYNVIQETWMIRHH